MTDFSSNFLTAFNNAMLYEVGPHWNPQDPEVQAGLIDTKEQRYKVGFTDTPGDSGGVTKFGIAQNSHSDISVKDLTLDQAIQIYYDSYWVQAHCEQLPYPFVICYFDACVNNGIARGAKLLQHAANVTADGAIGPGTLAAVSAADPTQLINNISAARTSFYNAVVVAHPEDQQFLNGWLTRNTQVTQFALGQQTS